MTTTPSKPCQTCGRTITWRRKWARDWEQVRYCSDACRCAKPTRDDVAIESAIIDVLSRRAAGATICLSEAARAIAGDDESRWRPLLPRVRWAANRLAAQGRIDITKSGRPIDPSTARGPIRLRLRDL